MNNKAPLIVAIAGLVLFAGCAHQRNHRRHAEFIPAEYEPYRGTGSGVVEGQAFLVSMNGEVKYGAGRTVVLNPVTTYSEEWFLYGVRGNYKLSEGDPRAGQFARTAVADAEGNFRFEGLPPGEYYVACEINWYIDQYSTSGGWAYSQVTVQNGKTIRAVVTRQ